MSLTPPRSKHYGTLRLKGRQITYIPPPPLTPPTTPKEDITSPPRYKHILRIKNGRISYHKYKMAASVSSSSTSPAPRRSRKVTIPFGLMCRKLRENGGVVKKQQQHRRIVLRRSSSQSSQ